MVNGMITCEEIYPQLAAYSDDELTTTQRELIQRHLDHCEHCSAEVHSLQSLSRHLTHTFDAFEAPSWIEQVVLAAVREADRTYEAERMKWATMFVASAMAFVVVGGALSPIGSLVWTLLGLLTHVLKAIFGTLVDLPFGAGTSLFSRGFVVLCFTLSLLSGGVFIRWYRRLHAIS